mgnify:CR=1 FL=1|tara:strand:- start:4555 stop:5346 length:792 start_codon:yes stop_codon:yes gene_type:complete
MPYADPYATQTTTAAGTEDLSFIKVDTTSGWTTANPSSIAGASAATDGSGLTTFKWTGVTDSVSDNNLTNGANFNGPRMYFPLVKPDGSNYTWDEAEGNLRLMVKITDFQRPRDDGSSNNAVMNAILGLCADPTSTSRNATSGMSLSGVGAGFGSVSAQRTFYGYTAASQNAIASITGRTGAGSVATIGNGVGAVDLMIQNASGANVLRNSRNTNIAPNAIRNGDPIYLCLAWGPTQQGQNISAAELKMKIAYKVINFETINN